MPAPVEDIIVAPQTATVTVALEPAANVFHSMLLLAKKNGVSGLDNWVAETILSMSSSERQRHRLVMIGLFYAAGPAGSWASFPAYLDHLQNLEPMALRDKIMNAYINLPCREDDGRPTPEVEEILETLDDFLDFLRQRFSPEVIDLGLESQAYTYIVDPPSMKRLIVSHLGHMWETYLSAEWARVEPMLMDAVVAFNQVDFSRMDKLEAAEFITGQSLSGGHMEKMIEKAERLVFMPSAHVGPYLGKAMLGDALAVLFGARLPEGSGYYAPDLSRAEVLVRLSALADDTRLRILKLLAEEGEMRSQSIMRRLELSQSAASRHLKQLSASGFLSERRCEGAKCYDINYERLEATLEAVSAFLLGA